MSESRAHRFEAAESDRSGRVWAMRTTSGALGLIAVATVWASASWARTWDIRADGSGDVPTIQAGADSAAHGDTLLVSPGTYYETVQIFDVKALVIRSTSGAASTIIDARHLGRVLTMRNASVEGVTIRHGLVEDIGGGVRVFGPEAAEVRHCIIEDNIAGLTYDTGIGGGLFLDGDTGGVVVASNVIRSNVATYAGGGIVDGGSSNIIRANVIAGNRADVLGGGVYMMWTSLLLGNIIVGNDGGYGGGGVFAPDAIGGEIRSNTVVGNRTSNGFVHGAGIQASGAVARISHNVVVDNHNAWIGGLTGAGIVANPVTIVECNDSWGNDMDEIVGTSTGATNFSADPQFCAVQPLTSLNFLLQVDSPCAPGNDPGGGGCALVGAAAVGCDTVSVERRTWSGVKRLFR